MAKSPAFDRSHLERSRPFEPLRVLSGAAGDALIAELREKLEPTIRRRRAWRIIDEERFEHSLSVMLANLLVAARNRIDPYRFLAVSFNANDYVGSALSLTALRRLRDGMYELGLVEGSRGYRHAVDGAVRHSRKTRLRATSSLRRLFKEHSIGPGNLAWSHERDIIVMREPDVPALPEPANVRASRNVLMRLNSALAEAAIALPESAWARVIARYDTFTEEREDDRVLAGDVETTTLCRIFKGGWDRGGRLYGGWWINIPRLERRYLRIDDEPTVERDYSRLHPTLLYARLNRELDFDIYEMPGFEGPEIRELGKRTFNRLINKTFQGPIRLATTALDRQQLGPNVSFQAYLNAFVDRLGPIAQWFGTGEGLRLQREDSDLAISVLDALLDRGVLALPVHDSFIVKRRHEATLVAVMTDQFVRRYGVPVTVR